MFIQHKHSPEAEEAHCTLDAKLIANLVERKICTENQCLMLEERSKGDQEEFEHLLIHEGFLSQVEFGTIKAETHGWEFVDLYKELISPELLALLPQNVAREQGAVAFRKEQGIISVAISRPESTSFIRLLQKKFGGRAKVYFATNMSILDALSRQEEISKKRFEDIITSHEKAVRSRDAEDSTVIELVDSMLLHGVNQRASDIHIEPRAHKTVVRERIDGVLRPTLSFTKDLHKLVTLRIKVLANLATDEHASPQDGKLLYETPAKKHVDVRVSIVPTTHGEKIVLRLLVEQDKALSLESLGLHGKDLDGFTEATKASWGMILVTGPTGSGKTTTLYAVMRRLNSDEVNVSTIEDPVEYELPGANQIQVNAKVNLTFATGLRSIVRQDPNIVLVGEIRDEETAGIAVNAAMTGHLVLSTLHTNDAATALPRLIDMGVEPFLISSTVNLIVAQRLVRAICEKCKETVEIPAADLRGSLDDDAFKQLAQGESLLKIARGKGCNLCGGTGFHGRTAIFELLQVDEKIRELIMANANADMIKKAAVEAGMITILSDGIEKVRRGITTIEEILRVI